MDVNGDGLPDRVIDNSGSLSVQLNLGYKLAAAEPWGSATLSDGQSLNGSLSFSYSDGVKGYAGGLSVSASATRNEAAVMDINGDGLPDRLYNDGNTLYVAFNTGAGFTAPVNWKGGLSERINSGLSTTMGGGISFVYPIGPLCLVTCFIIVNPEVNYGQSMSREETMIRMLTVMDTPTTFIPPVMGASAWRSTARTAPTC